VAIDGPLDTTADGPRGLRSLVWATWSLRAGHRGRHGATLAGPPARRDREL